MIDPGERSIVQEVEQAVQLLMPAGRASIASVADSLGMTVRTLQRRLDDDDTQFSDLLDRVRVREVTRHLSQRRLRLTDIADRLAIHRYLRSATGIAAGSRKHRARHGGGPGRAAHNHSSQFVIGR